MFSTKVLHDIGQVVLDTYDKIWNESNCPFASNGCQKKSSMFEEEL